MQIFALLDTEKPIGVKALIMSSKKADLFSDLAFASFFQNSNESDLIDQVEWAEEKLGLSDRFYARLLRIGTDRFVGWRTGTGAIESQTEDNLREFWETLRHILSFLNFNLESVCVMLDHKSDSETASTRLSFRPPWIGTSIKNYLETEGPDGIEKVNAWIQAVRFSDP